jgi:hypothetical protein
MQNPNETREFIFVDRLVDELIQPEFNQYRIPTGKEMTIKELNDYLTVRLGEDEDLEKTLDWYKKNVAVSAS